MRLTNIRKIGRFQSKMTSQEVNLHKGRVVGRSTDVIFYLYRGKRMYMSDRAFYEDWTKVEPAGVRIPVTIKYSRVFQRFFVEHAKKGGLITMDGFLTYQKAKQFAEENNCEVIF